MNPEEARVPDVPDSPEGVALVLLQLILDREGSKDLILGLYGECLALASRRIEDLRREVMLHH